jgi:DNA-binding XRE family transcriptional regulator
MKKKPVPSADFELPKKQKKEYEKSAGYRKVYNTEKFMYSVAETLQEERLKHHFTQKKLARRSGLKQQEISRLEKGDANATLKTLYKIAQGMGKKLVIKIT